MIKYALKCAEDHGFESWFKSSDAFDALAAAQMLSCPICGNSDISKAVMTPRVVTARTEAPATGTGETTQSLLTHPSDEVQEAMARLRAAVEANSDYVGANFTSEARAIHDGEAPRRSIYGEANPDEARKLLEDGVPVLPLPFLPNRKLT